MNEQHVRVGIIGAGWPGERHAEGFLASGQAMVGAVADLEETRRGAFAARYGVSRQYADYRELLDDPDLDAVVIALPNFLHRKVAVEAMKAGKHVLCEKPPATTTAEAQEMANVATQHGRILGYATWRRFTPSADLLLAHQAEEVLGEIYHARAVWTRTWGVPQGVGGWFTDPVRAGGGPLIDIGIHVLDLAWFIMGCPVPVTVSGQVYNKFPSLTRTEDSAFALVRFENGRSLHVETSWVLAKAEDEFDVHFYGTEGGACINDNSLSFFTIGDAGVTSKTPRLLRGLYPAFISQAADFVRAIQEDGRPRTDADQGVLLMAMLEGIYRSAQQGREISLDPIHHP